MIAALSFLTIVGAGAAPENRSMRWFGVVGALVGGILGALWWSTAQVTSPLMAAAIAVTIDLVVTGMLHLDGVADAGDGLLPHMDRERRLAVMSEPTIGAFGVTVVGMVLVLRVAAIASLAVDAASIVTIASLWSLARSAMVICALRVPYARPSGIASMFVGGADGSTYATALAAALVALAALVVVSGWIGAFTWVGAVAAMAGVVALSRRRLGGYTGDVLGALGVIGETVGLIVAGAQW